jgi:hypothetical protein
MVSHRCILRDTSSTVESKGFMFILYLFSVLCGMLVGFLMVASVVALGHFIASKIFGRRLR